MADSISEALLALALGQGRRLTEALAGVAIEGLSHETEAALFASLARLLVRQHGGAESSGTSGYQRALRSLLGGPDGVLVLLDSLPLGPAGYEASRLQAFERRWLGWRWRLRERGDRLRTVHQGLRLERIMVLPPGEVVMFEPRFEPGDPAVDLSAVAVGLLELGAREPLAWPDGYKPLFDVFWSTYLSHSGDHELLDVAPPFLAWRALQAASPLSPSPLPPAAQRKLFAFAEEVLAQRSFDPDVMSGLMR